MPKQLSTILQTTDPLDLLLDVTTADVIALPLLVVGVGLLTGTVGFVGVLAVGAVLEAIGESFD